LEFDTKLDWIGTLKNTKIYSLPIVKFIKN